MRLDDHDKLFERHSRRVLRLGCAIVALYGILGAAFIAVVGWGVVTLLQQAGG